MRALDALNASLFRDRHPELVHEIDLVESGGASELSYPADGQAILDQVLGGYVLVWRDASARWHYIDLSDDPTLAAQFNLAPYVSPGASFLQNALDQAYKVFGGVGELVSWVPWIVGGWIVISLLSVAGAPRRNPPRRRQYRTNPPDSIEIGFPVEKVLYRKRPGHGDCDAECRSNGHRYVHTFKKGFPLIGRANGKLEI